MLAIVLAAALTLPPQKSDAVIGVAAIHLEKGTRVSVRGAERFPMGSVYKFPIGLAVMHQADRGKLSLRQELTIEPTDFSPGWSPLRDRANGKPVTLPIYGLVERMVSISDNTACDALLRLVGGGPVVTKRLRDLGITGIRVDRQERDIAKELRQPGGVDAYWRDVRDSATPDQMLELLMRFHQKKDGLSDKSHTLMNAWLTNTPTGPRRIKSALPGGASLAHKTGTMPGTVNDVGIITLPNGEHIAIAVFTKARKKASEEAAEDDVAAVTRAVLAALQR